MYPAVISQSEAFVNGTILAALVSSVLLTYNYLLKEINLFNAICFATRTLTLL